MENDFEQNDIAGDLPRMKSEYHDVDLPPYLENDIVAGLKSRHLIAGRKKWHRHSLSRAAAVFIIAALAFASGWYLNSREAGNAIADNDMNKQSYLVLLYDSKDFVPDENYVNEYASWMQSLGRQGIEISGRELKNTGWTFSGNTGGKPVNQPVAEKYGMLSGFFIIRASEEKALKLVAGCPHLAHNGTIELRPVKN